MIDQLRGIIEPGRQLSGTSMKLFLFSLSLTLSFAIGVVGYFQTRNQELGKLCSHLNKGLEMAEVREKAREMGFEPKLEAFAQMRIESTPWHPDPPQCRVFFNSNRTLEYRVWQEG